MPPLSLLRPARAEAVEVDEVANTAERILRVFLVPSRGRGLGDIRDHDAVRKQLALDKIRVRRARLVLLPSLFRDVVDLPIVGDDQAIIVEGRG
jgi:hypothetical protein